VYGPCSEHVEPVAGERALPRQLVQQLGSSGQLSRIAMPAVWCVKDIAKNAHATWHALRSDDGKPVLNERWVQRTDDMLIVTAHDGGRLADCSCPVQAALWRIGTLWHSDAASRTIFDDATHTVRSIHTCSYLCICLSILVAVAQRAPRHMDT
jgi:hypothetical protein